MSEHPRQQYQAGAGESGWMLCPAAKAHAEKTGLITRCASNPGHTCDGPRTPYVWKAWMYADDGARIEKDSEEPCCSSCMTDEESGHGDFSRCCCVHWPVGRPTAT
jgi:hypothetical protein